MLRSLALVLLLAAPASAQTLFDRGPPRHRLVHRSLVAARYNPVGVVYDGRLGYRFRLYEHESKALRDNYAGIGAGFFVNPASLRIGPVVEIAPASVLTLWSSLSLLSFFGSFDQLQSF